MKISLTGALALAALSSAVAVLLALRFSSPASDDPVAATSSPSRHQKDAAALLAHSASRTPRVGARREIDDAILHAPVHDAVELDAYLDNLEAQARARGHVTALDIEPGLAMIQQHSEDPQRVAAFSERMLKLQEELSGRARPEPPRAATAHQQLRALSSRIQHSDGEEKQEAIRQYLKAAEALPDQQEAEALASLNTMVQAVPQAPDSSALAALLTGIQQAPDQVKRQELIREYLEYSEGLPEEEHQRAMADLQRFAVPAATHDEHAATP